MRVVSFITQPRVIRTILEHLRNRKPNTRAPPPQPGAAQAQQAYAETGALPELLSIYHLLGDPALTLR